MDLREKIYEEWAPILQDMPNKKKDAINPAHYQAVACGKQYMELMEEMLEGFEGVEAHLVGQVYKYMMRLGKKDAKEQDAKKAAWYAQALVNHYQGKSPLGN